MEYLRENIGPYNYKDGAIGSINICMDAFILIIKEVNKNYNLYYFKFYQ